MENPKHTAEFLKTSSYLLGAEYGFIGIFPLFWGYPFVHHDETPFMTLLFVPFLVMAASLYLMTKREVTLVHGIIVTVAILVDLILQLIFLKDLSTFVGVVVFFLIYGIYFIPAYSLGDVYTAKLRGWESIFIALQQKAIFTPLLLIFILIISLGA